MNPKSTGGVGDLLEELRQTACLLARRSDIVVVEEFEERGWSFNSATGVISMDANRLRTESGDFNRGLLMHEGAHAAITRLRRLLKGTYLARAEVFSVINAVEDCRIEAFLLERFPGCRPWIETYNNKLIRSRFQGSEYRSPSGIPPILGLPWMIVSSWWHGRDAVDLPPEWLALRDEVWPAIEAIVGLIPRGQLPAHEIRRRYDRSSLPTAFLMEDIGGDPDVWELEVRLCQEEMWRHFEQGILPVIRRLVPDSGPVPSRQLERTWLEAWLSVHLGPHAQRGPSRGNDRIPSIAAWYQATQGGAGTASESPSWASDLPRYEQMQRRQATVIETVSEEMLRRLHPETHRRWQGPFPSGSRLCLRSAIRAEGDPRLREQVWRRRSHWTRPDPLVVLLADRSGSMEGERMEGTAEAMVLLAETCARAGVGLSAFSFAMHCTPILDWREALDDEARGRIGGLAEAAEGGTDLREALEIVGRHLLESDFTHRYLIVLSDGIVEDGDAIRLQLRLLEAQGIRVMGLGLGERTAKLGDVIRESRVELKPDQLPAAFVELLERTVERTAEP